MLEVNSQEDAKPSFKDVPLPTTALPPPARNVAIIQKIIDGLAEEVNVQPPVINACVDENAGRSYVKLMTQILNQLSFKDWVGLPKTVERIKNGFPQKTQQCLVDDASMKALWDAYGVTDLGWTELYFKLSGYAKDGNYEMLMQNLTDVNTLYQKGQYENAGKLLGQVIISVVAYNPDAISASSFKLLRSIKRMLSSNEGYRNNGNGYNNDDGFTSNNYGNLNVNNYYNDAKDQDEDSEYQNRNLNDPHAHYDTYNYYNINVNNIEGEYPGQNNGNNHNNGNWRSYNGEENGYNTPSYNNINTNNDRRSNFNDEDYSNPNSNNNNQGYPGQGQLGGGNNYYQNNNAYDQDNDNNQGEQYQDHGNGNNYNKQDGYQESGNSEGENDDPAPQLVYTIFQGVAEFVGQKEPVSLQSCLDAKSGRIILNFFLNAVGEINDKGFDRLGPTLDGFLNVVPQKSLRCIAESPDFAHILRAYNIRERNLQNFLDKIIQYSENDNLPGLTQKALQILISADREDFHGLGQNTGKLLELVYN